jgi:putative addiction module component (TIGR02574 family)
VAIPTKLVTQVLELPDDERGALAALLLHSLEPHDGDELTGEAWEAAWSAEIERRAREVEAGTAELIDGDEVMAEMRAMVDAPTR